MALDPAPRRAAFRRLHERGCFTMPNAWDAGSARFLAHLGFPALASTSAGLAFSRGLPDGAVPLEDVLGHLRELVGAADLPVNADLEAGFAAWPAGVAESVRRCVDTGVAGLSIEDATGRPEAPLYELPEAVERLRAARDLIQRGTFDGLGEAATFAELNGLFGEALRRRDGQPG